MAWEVKYQLGCYDIALVKWHVDIELEDYSGEINTLYGAKYPIEFQFNKENDDVFDSMRDTSVVIRITATEDFQLFDIYTDEFLKYRVKIYQDDVLFWMGYLRGKGYSQPYDIVPHVIELTAQCGLTILQETNYMDESSAGEEIYYNGRKLESEIILDILGQINHTSFAEFVNIYEENMNSDVEDSPMDQIKIDVDVFKDMTCYEVLIHILRKYNAFIMLYIDTFYIIRPTELLGDTVYGRLFTDFITKSAISFSTPQYIDRPAFHSSFLKQIPGGTMIIQPTTKKITVNQDYGFKESWLDNWQFKVETFDGYNFENWEPSSGQTIQSVMGLMKGERDGVILFANTAAPTQYLEQVCGNGAIISVTDYFVIDLEYSCYNAEVVDKTVDFYIDFIQSGNYLKESGDDENLEWDTPYIGVAKFSESFPPGWSDWQHYKRMFVGLPADGEITVRLAIVTASPENVWGAFRNFQLYATSVNVQQKRVRRSLKERIANPAGMVMMPWDWHNKFRTVITVEPTGNVVENQYEVENSDYGNEVVKDYVLGDVTSVSDPVKEGDVNIENIVAQFFGSLAVWTPDSSGGDEGDLIASSVWNTRGGSESKPLLEIIGDEIAYQYSNPTQLIQMKIQDVDVEESSKVSCLNMFGNFQDDLNRLYGVARRFVFNRGTFDPIIRQWEIDLAEITAEYGGFQTEWTLTDPDTTITLPLSAGNSSTFDFCVDWGDDSEIEHYTTHIGVSHTYSSAGTYTIEIKGVCEGWSFGDGTHANRDHITKVLHWGTPQGFAGFKYLFRGFRNCRNLTELASGGIRDNGLINLWETFLDCQGLLAIPEDLFIHCVNVTVRAYSNTFYQCVKVESVSGLLFSYSPKASSYAFQGTFYGCVKLAIIGAGLFDNNPLVSIYGFYQTFYGCWRIVLLPDGLYAKNVLVSSYGFYQTHRGCYGLEAVEEGLFANNIAVCAPRGFSQTFYGCNKLKLNRHIFFIDDSAGVGKETRFYSIACDFRDCFTRDDYTNLESAPGEAPELWDCNWGRHYPARSSFCFDGAGNDADSLSNYEDIPSEAWIEGQLIVSTQSIEYAQAYLPDADTVYLADADLAQSLAISRISSAVADAISNSNTMLNDYQPNEAQSGYDNRDLRVPDGVVTDLEYYSIPGIVRHVGEFTGKIYCNGPISSVIYVADTWDDLIAGTIHNICNTPFPYGVSGIREMANGELIVCGGNALVGGEVAPEAGIWISDDWATNSATNTPVDFILTQNWLAKYNNFADAWGISVKENKVLISEYSTKGTFENSYVFYSDDYGVTFSPVFDIETQYGVSPSYQHIHGCCIDPYWDRLWVFPGEASVGQKVIAYSDDDGVTWTSLSTLGMAKTLVTGVTTLMKFTASFALDTGVIMGTDSQPNGIWRFNRITKDYEFANAYCIEEAKRFDLKVTDTPITGYSGHERTISHMMGFVTRMIGLESGESSGGAGENYPILVSCPMVGSTDYIFTEDQSGIVLISYDGVRFYEIWREDDTETYPAPGVFADAHTMQAWCYADGTIYIMTKGSNRQPSGSQIIKGKLPDTTS